jgi:hypothetical protein
VDDSIATEYPNGSEQEMKRRESSVSSINSSAGKKFDFGKALFKLSNNQDQLDTDKPQIKVIQQREEPEKQKRNLKNERSERANSIQRQKMKLII